LRFGGNNNARHFVYPCVRRRGPLKGAADFKQKKE
jgi:hypothetical protein